MHSNNTNLEHRKKVWIAFSDLFLDTDVSLSYEYISRVCAESEYTLEELKDILEKEVAPVCSANLLCVAGAWAGFNEDWLLNNILGRTYGKGRIFSKLLSPLKNIGFRSYLDHHWKKLAVLIVEKRKNT